MLNDLTIENWKANGAYFRSTKAEGMMVFVQEVGHFCQLGSPEAWLHSIIPFYKKDTI